VTRRLWTTKEVADWAGVTERTVLREIVDGNLPARRIRTRWRVDPDDLDRWGQLAEVGQVLPLPVPPIIGGTDPSESEEANRGDDSRTRSRHDRDQATP
jgi:excisionase family DNA binding protein